MNGWRAASRLPAECHWDTSVQTPPDHTGQRAVPAGIQAGPREDSPGQGATSEGNGRPRLVPVSARVCAVIAVLAIPEAACTELPGWGLRLSPRTDFAGDRVDQQANRAAAATWPGNSPAAADAHQVRVAIPAAKAVNGRGSCRTSNALCSGGGIAGGISWSIHSAELVPRSVISAASSGLRSTPMATRAMASVKMFVPR